MKEKPVDTICYSYSLITGVAALDVKSLDKDKAYLRLVTQTMLSNVNVSAEVGVITFVVLVGIVVAVGDGGGGGGGGGSDGVGGRGGGVVIV